MNSAAAANRSAPPRRCGDFRACLFTRGPRASPTKKAPAERRAQWCFRQMGARGGISRGAKTRVSDRWRLSTELQDLRTARIPTGATFTENGVRVDFLQAIRGQSRFAPFDLLLIIRTSRRLRKNHAVVRHTRPFRPGLPLRVIRRGNGSQAIFFAEADRCRHCRRLAEAARASRAGSPRRSAGDAVPAWSLAPAWRGRAAAEARLSSGIKNGL